MSKKRRSIVEAATEAPVENASVDEDDEFFDANEYWDENSSLSKWSSMELEHADLDNTTSVCMALKANEGPVTMRR
jgi:hypothetical protein